MKDTLAGLYYPFSRCIQPNSLKQMLLVFDEITFIDPVEDDRWRAKLFEDLELHDTKFETYRSVDERLPALVQEGCVRRHDPTPLINNCSMATKSAISDLSDPDWVMEASSPRRHAMPSIVLNGVHSWQAFKPKMPDSFLNALQTHPALRSHLLNKGSNSVSWSLSYAAGSAIAIGVHLEMAGELGLAPVTDSLMHHRLLMMKMSRTLSSHTAATPIPEDVLRTLTTEVATTMLSHVLPPEDLQRTTFEQIIRFREETASLRKQFISDLFLRIGQLRTIPTAQDWVVVCRQVRSGLESELRKYESEFVSAKGKIWPGILKATTNGMAAGSLAAVGLSLIPTPHALLSGGIAGVAIGAATAALEWKAERARIEKSAAPPVAYLSRVSKL